MKTITKIKLLEDLILPLTMIPFMLGVWIMSKSGEYINFFVYLFTLTVPGFVFCGILDKIGKLMKEWQKEITNEH